MVLWLVRRALLYNKSIVFFMLISISGQSFLILSIASGPKFLVLYLTSSLFVAYNTKHVLSIKSLEKSYLSFELIIRNRSSNFSLASDHFDLIVENNKSEYVSFVPP